MKADTNRFLEFALPEGRTVRGIYQASRRSQGEPREGPVPMKIAIDGGQPFDVVHRHGRVYKQGQSTPIADERLKVYWDRLRGLNLLGRDGNGVVARGLGDWLGCMGGALGGAFGLGYCTTKAIIE